MISELKEIIGNNDRLLNACLRLIKLADNKLSILIQGEDGTGREILARAFHYQGSRSQGPFIKLTCATMPQSLYKEELFGKTSKSNNKEGCIELANNGTLFLDEVQNIPPSVQDSLLAFLKEGEFKKINGSESIKVDVRLISATSVDLERIAKKSKFREDLYFYLSLIPLYIPPLRERKEDIPSLVEHFLEKYSHETRKTISISPDAMKILIEYDWPGNTKELEYLIKKTILSISPDEDTILIKHLNLEGSLSQREEVEEIKKIDKTEEIEKKDDPPKIENPKSYFSFKKGVEELERRIIIDALKKYNWNQSETASYLSISRTTLRYRMKKLGIPEKI